MNRLRRNLISSARLGRRSWTCWKKIAPGTTEEIGSHFGALGMIEVQRHIYGDRNDHGTVRFTAGGRYWYFAFNPCPSRLGLVRMAKAIRVEVERYLDACLMLQANGAFMGRKWREEFARGVEIMARKLGVMP